MNSTGTDVGPVAPPARRGSIRGFALRLWVLLRHRRLDEDLRAGIDATGRPALELRAEQLTRPRYRRRLAAAVDSLIEDYHGHRAWLLSPGVPYIRHQVGEAHGVLLAIAEALREAVTIKPRGVAEADRLLRDTTSPLYLERDQESLQAQAHDALDHLVGATDVSPDHWWADSPGTPRPVAH